jgi:hypothetical protein
VGLSLAGWQFMHRGFMITFAASVKRARERGCVSTILEKAEGERSSTAFCASLVVGLASKRRNPQSKEVNEAICRRRLTLVCALTISLCADHRFPQAAKRWLMSKPTKLVANVET